jgi:hypothetical protein
MYRLRLFCLLNAGGHNIRCRYRYAKPLLQRLIIRIRGFRIGTCTLIMCISNWPPAANAGRPVLLS